MMKLEFKELMQLIVLCSLVVFAALILIMSYMFPYEFNNEFLTLLNLIVGALIGVLGVKGVDSISNKDNDNDKDINVNTQDTPKDA